MDEHGGQAPVSTPSRRTFLRRGVVVGGTLLWAVPTVNVLDLNARAAASTSGPVSPGSYPSNFVVMLNVRAVPAGETGWPAVGTNIGIMWAPGEGFVRPDPTGQGNCLNTTTGNPVYDDDANDLAPILAWLNAHPSQCQVSQSTTLVNNQPAPAYTLVITNTYFRSALISSSPDKYGPVAYAKNGLACNVPAYQADVPIGFDTYLFPGKPGG